MVAPTSLAFPRSTFGVLLLSVVATFGAAQQRGAPSTPVTVVDDSVQAASSLDGSRRVTLNLKAVPLGDAIEQIVRQSGVELVYSKAVVPLRRVVSVRVADMPALRALETVLDSVDVTLRRNGQSWLLVPKPRSGIRGLGGSIVGRVTDSATTRGVSDVEVALDGTSWRTRTDSGGRYRFASVDSGSYVMNMRRIGYVKWSRRVVVSPAGEDTVDVILAPMTRRLDELVSTATGRRHRFDVANDITTINADSVMRASPVRSLTDLLENRVPGLTVQHTSGAPGDPARLRLRGVSSPLGTNDPIVVVDGVRVYSEQSAARNVNLASNAPGAGTYATPSPLDYIDPNAIETIEVVKGPSAATMYGPDAANGVIVITTKKGHAGPTRWDAGVEIDRTRMEGKYPELLWPWGHDLFSSGPTYCPNTRQYASASYGYQAFPCQVDSVKAFQILNDPSLTVLDPHGGSGSQGSIAVSGGAQAITYHVTGTYQNNLGLVRLPAYEADRFQAVTGSLPPDWMQRPERYKVWSVVSSVSMRIGSNADLSFTTGLTRNDQQRSSLEQRLGTLQTTYLDQGSGLYYGYNVNNGLADTAGNPLAAYYERATSSATSFTNGVQLSYNPRRWLSLSASAGLNFNQRSDGIFFPRGPEQGPGGDTTGYVSNAVGRVVESTLHFQSNARAPLGRGFQFRFAAGADYNGRSINDFSGSSRVLAPGTSLGGAIVTSFVPSEFSDATFGWGLEPSIGNSKLNFSTGLRLDGGKNYGGNVTGFRLPKFPRLGFSYVISDERWFPLKDLIQSLRLRVSYGKSSTQPGPTDRLRLYTIPGLGYADSQALFGVTLLALGNTEIRPERIGELEGGFDVDMLDGRVSVNLSAYRKTTEDALLPMPIAPSVYGDGVSIKKNIGSIRNTGLEAFVSVTVLRDQKLTWLVRGTLSGNHNAVLELGPGVTPFYIADHENFGGGGVRVAAGYPLYGRWSRPILGYSDANGNGALEPQEVQLGDTAIYAGPTIPGLSGGFGTSVTLWGGAVSVNANFSYKGGSAQRNELARQLSVFSPGRADTLASLAQQAAMIDLTGSTSLRSYGTDYNWIETVNELRFDDLQVSYQIPAALARRVGARQLIVSASGTNLGLWTSYRGIDPNVNAFSTGNNVSDTGILPQPRRWQLGIHASY